MTTNLRQHLLNNNILGVVTKDQLTGGTGSVTFDTPSSISPGSSNTEGVSDSAARADHVHQLPAFGTTAGTFAQGNDSRFPAALTPGTYGSATTVPVVVIDANGKIEEITELEIESSGGTGGVDYQTEIDFFDDFNRQDVFFSAAGDGWLITQGSGEAYSGRAVGAPTESNTWGEVRLQVNGGGSSNFIQLSQARLFKNSDIVMTIRVKLMHSHSSGNDFTFFAGLKVNGVGINNYGPGTFGIATWQGWGSNWVICLPSNFNIYEELPVPIVTSEYIIFRMTLFSNQTYKVEAGSTIATLSTVKTGSTSFNTSEVAEVMIGMHNNASTSQVNQSMVDFFRLQKGIAR